MEIGAFDAIEVTEAGLREGVFYETLLEGRDPPLFEDVRRDGVLNLAATYSADFAHTEHVARLALAMWDALGEAGVHPCDPRERDLLWAASMLHDIGTAVDYDDHHKHSRYLILNAGLPGFTPARDRPDRPDRPLPPQGQAVARRSPARSRATATRRCCCAARRSCGSASSSSARATSRCTRRRGRR